MFDSVIEAQMQLVSLPVGDGLVVWLAVLGGVVAAACAAACAVACAWLARATQMRASQPVHRIHAPVTMVPVSTPMPALAPAPFGTMSHDRIPDHVVLDRVTGPPRAPIILEGNYPQLGPALGAWLQAEPDDVERIRIARDLGTVGGAGSARALLDGVRTGVLSPTIAADQLERGGFEAGITVAAALRDPEPRVRALAASLVGRTAPLEPVRTFAAAPSSSRMPPMPEPPAGPLQ